MSETPSIEIIADTGEGMVEAILESPDLDQPVKVVLSPETARQVAFTLTKASYAAEGDESLL